MISKIYIILTYVVLYGYAETLSLDQRQNGEFNVQVDLKDIQIYAVLSGGNKEEYVDYDYAYDYSQLTIKPQNRTTPKPLTSSSTAATNDLTIATAIVYEHSNSATLDISNTTELDNSSITLVSDVSSTSTVKIVTENVTQAPTIISTESSKRNTTHGSRPNAENPICRKGFVVVNKECQPKTNSTENAEFSGDASVIVRIFSIERFRKSGKIYEYRTDDKINQTGEIIAKAQIKKRE